MFIVEDNGLLEYVLGSMFGTFHSRILYVSLKRFVLLGRGVETPDGERSFLPVPADQRGEKGVTLPYRYVGPGLRSWSERLGRVSRQLVCVTQYC